MADSCGFVDI